MSSLVESITGHLSRRMRDHYSHILLNAKKAALDRLDERLARSPRGAREILTGGNRRPSAGHGIS